MAVVTVVAVLAVLGWRPLTADAAGPAFGDGHWSGDATFVGDWQVNNIAVDITSGGCSFDMTITGAKVAAGAITCSGTTAGKIGSYRVTTRWSSTGSLSGPAGAVVGTLNTVATGTVMGRSGSFQIAASVKVKPDTLDCGMASGDLAAQDRSQVLAAGGSSTETAEFYAVRDSGAGRPPSTTTREQFNKLVSDLAALAHQSPQRIGADAYVLELERLAAATSAYLSKVLPRASCGPGSNPAATVQQDVLARAFQSALERVLVGPHSATFTVAQLGRILDIGLQTGAIVPPWPVEGAENGLWHVLETDLGKQLDAAVLGHDQNTIFYIYALASGAGMADLANRAAAAMNK